MTPARLIKKLMAAPINMTEEQIADALRQQGIDCTQGTVNRIKSGYIKRTSFEIGMGLLQLAENRSRKVERRSSLALSA